MRSGGQPNIGRMLSVAGPPIRITAIRRSLLRSSTAFVACVVPSMTWVIRSRSTSGERSTVSIAVVIPPVISGVPGTLALAITRSAPSMITASVLVPPTSTPRRQSGAGTGELLYGQVVKVVTERAGAGDRDAPLSPPHRVAGEGDHHYPLAVLDPFRRDRVGCLHVQH